MATVTQLIDQTISELKNAMALLDQARDVSFPVPQITSPHNPPIVGDRLVVS